MKHTGFFYGVAVSLVVTRHDIAMLTAMSKRHYDSKCQQASKRDGSIFALDQQWRNERAGDDAFVVWGKTFAEALAEAIRIEEAHG